MTDAQQREAARQFYYRWNGKGKEDEDARSYWIEILQNILGVENVTERIDFEKKVIGPDGNTKRIDVYIPETQVLIEQKSLGIALDKPQAGHGGLTPYEQAKMYDNGLPHSEKSRWIVTSNFAEIWIYDMEEKKPEEAVVKITLTDFPTKFHMLDFLVKKEVKRISDEMAVSLQAGEIVGLLYDAFHKQYKNPDDPETLKSLNKLCVRIVFLLYAEDAGILGKKGMFHDYMEQFSPSQARKGLRDLFKVLNQRPEERDPYLADDDPMLAAFPYVNGGLFEDDAIEIPRVTFTVPDEIANYDTVEKYIWFSVYDSVARRTLAPGEYTCTHVLKPTEIREEFNAPEYADYLVAISAQPLTLKIKPGWNVRFLNLPIGTTYAFEEVNIPTGYDFVKAEVGATRWIANMVDGTDQGSAQNMTSLPSNTSANNNDTEISGTIDFANARYNTTYTNKTLTQHVIIQKTSQDGTTPLSGAVFSLYTENGYNADPKAASKTDLTSGTNGQIDLGALAYGKYYLVETSAPAGYILLSEPVVITVAHSRSPAAS